MRIYARVSTTLSFRRLIQLNWMIDAILISNRISCMEKAYDRAYVDCGGTKS